MRLKHNHDVSVKIETNNESCVITIKRLSTTGGYYPKRYTVKHGSASDYRIGDLLERYEGYSSYDGDNFTYHFNSRVKGTMKTVTW